MAAYKRGRIWWYKLTWNGEPIRKSTKQANKRIADQMEAAHRTSLAKGEVGIRDRVPAGRISSKRISNRPCRHGCSTSRILLPFYQNGLRRLKAHRALALCPLETITADNISSFVAALGEDGLAVANINQPRGGSFEAGAEASVGMAGKVELLRGENHWDRAFY